MYIHGVKTHLRLFKHLKQFYTCLNIFQNYFFEINVTIIIVIRKINLRTFCIYVSCVAKTFDNNLSE